MDKSNTNLPKVPESFRIGNRGEAFLEFIMSKHCLMHKIAGYKDIGIDYICEWLVENSPTRILFGIQVKTSDIIDVELTPLGRNKGYNGLERFKFAKTAPSWEIKRNTINYWFGIDLPLYLFFVLRSNSCFNCYYQRLTPILHKKDKEKAAEEIQNYKNNELYKANDDQSEFRAIIDRHGQDGGFARDLFFDSVRCSYYVGSLRYRDSLEFGLKGWEGKSIYADILGENDCPYMEKVGESLNSLKNLGIISILPEWEERIREIKKNPHKRVRAGQPTHEANDGDSDPKIRMIASPDGGSVV
jgi:hypothetical protein